MLVPGERGVPPDESRRWISLIVALDGSWACAWSCTRARVWLSSSAFAYVVPVVEDERDKRDTRRGRWCDGSARFDRFTGAWCAFGGGVTLLGGVKGRGVDDGLGVLGLSCGNDEDSASCSSDDRGSDDGDSGLARSGFSTDARGVDDADCDVRVSVLVCGGVGVVDPGDGRDTDMEATRSLREALWECVASSIPPGGGGRWSDGDELLLTRY